VGKKGTKGPKKWKDEREVHRTRGPRPLQSEGSLYWRRKQVLIGTYSSGGGS